MVTKQPQKSEISTLSKLLYSLRVPKSAYEPLSRSLTEAACRNDIESVKYFLESGSNIQEKTIGHASPLHAACSFGNIDVANYLYQSGALLQVESEMFTCIHFAAGKGFVDIVKWALEQGFPLDKAASALSNAALCGHYEIVKILIDKGVDPVNSKVYGSGANKKTPSYFARNAGFTALADFIEGKEFDRELHIQQAKKRFDVSNPNGLENARLENPIERNKALENAIALIKSFSDVNEVDSEGIPLIIRAVSTGEINIVKEMLSCGASSNVNAEVGGITPLIESTVLGLKEIMQILLDSGADINATDKSGGTPLMYAAARGDLSLVKLLVTSGADVAKKDSNGRNAAKHTAGPFINQINEVLKINKNSQKKKKK